MNHYTPHHRHCPLFLVKLLPLQAQHPHQLDLTRIPRRIRGPGRPRQPAEEEVVPWFFLREKTLV